MAKTTARLARRLRDLVAWQARDGDIREEMAFHVESLARQYEQEGMTHQDARAAARRQFGSLLQMKERGHDVRGAGALEAAGREMRHALRRLLHAPAFTATAVVTLALAIGANAAIFSVVQRVVLDPLPYPQSDRLILVEHGIPRIDMASGIGMTSGLYEHYRDAAVALDGIAMYRPGEVTIAGTGEPERIRVLWTTPTLSQVLRIPPAAGRWFSAAEGRPGAPQAVVLSHGLWTRKFGGNPSVVGTSIALDGSPATVVGIMPASFAFPDPRVDAWLADQIAPAAGFGAPFSRTGLARLRDGATVADARASIDAAIARLPDAFPADAAVAANVGPGGLRSAAIPLKEAVVGNVARGLWMLLAAVGIVLLIACANVANLFLVRAESRCREVAVRRALGASGPGIARFFFAESTLLSLAGAAGGLGLAWGAARLLAAFGPATLPRLHEIGLDRRTVAMTLTAGLLVALAFGSIPLWRATPLAASLRDLGRTTASARRHRARHLLMAAQVALALVLLITAGLMIRSFDELRAFDPGFEPAAALSFRVGLPRGSYPTRDAAVRTHHAILRELSGIPGTVAVSASTGLPLEPSCFGNAVRLHGRAITSQEAPPVAVFCAVAGDYVRALGLRVLRGRTLPTEDIERGRAEVLVNEAFSDRVFPDEDPLGKQIRSSAPPTSPPRRDSDGELTWDGAPPWLTIVGVVSNTPWTALTEPNPVPVIYMPVSLAGGPDIPPIAMLGPSVSTLTYVVRTSGSPLAVVSPVRRAVEAIDPNLAVADVRPLEDVVARGAAQMAFTMVLLTIAAATAVALAVTGIVGVISYIVGQRTNEIGVRLALGAAPGEVAFAVARQGLVVAAAGAAVGLAAALAGGRLIESLLYAVGPRDPVVFAATTVALLAIALAACWWPARRAAGINPLDALRVE